MNPTYVKQELAQCAGCTVVSFLWGFLLDMNYISWSCVSNVNNLAY